MKKVSRILALAVSVAVLPMVALQARTMIQNKGSDTLVNVAQAWAEAYQKVKPDVAIAVTGGGSGTGFAALLNGTVELANASRAISEKEKKLAAEKKIDPKEYTVGFDALGVFVHKSNPLESISLTQLAEMYGDGGTLTSWDKLKVTVPGCKDGKVILVSRQNNSGTYEYFREAVLGKRDFVMGTKDLHGSKDVVDLVAHTPCAIGYSGMAYATSDIKMLKISAKEGDTPIEGTMDTAISRVYPIARPLFMYTNGEPTGDLKAYLDYIMSDIGQCVLQNTGFAPVRKIPCAKP
ncbi:MAG: phosphate ABC transporter substrate-binding protein [Magnetococcales bacterium]|nr:phosphate ABC transporter substrate-binding protein [Magnetococcales bacterium]